MPRLGLLALLLGLGVLVACEDDSEYSIGPATFSNDIFDGGAAGAGNADAAGGAPGAAGTSGMAGKSGAAGTSGAAGSSDAGA